MDFSDFDNGKTQKSGDILCYSHLPSLSKLFRIIEFCLGMVFVYWVFNRLPFLFTISIEFFRRIAGIITRPIFIFVLCNAIIVTLIVKSVRFSGENPAADNAETELYKELLKNNENHRCFKSFSSENPPHSPPQATEEIEYQDKEIIVSKINSFSEIDGFYPEKMELLSVSDSESDSNNPRLYRRTKSEKLEMRYDEKMQVKKVLQRSETEKCKNEAKSGLCLGDELSDKEFQRAVDEFIAKHLRFRRQESWS